MKLHVKNEKTFNEKATKQRIAKTKKRVPGEKKDENWIQFSRTTFFVYILFFTTQNTHTRGKKQ
jgi:hypothetical protein